MSIVRHLALLITTPSILATATSTCSTHNAHCTGQGAVLLQTQGKLKKPVEDSRSLGAVEASNSTGAKCEFVVEPMTPYYWDPTCKLGVLGCLADGIHPECRFCGDVPYTGIKCPHNSVPPKLSYCEFEPEQNMPVADFYWDDTCEDGMLGCKADGTNIECRFCGGEGDYKNITCPQCMFQGVPSTPYFWDHSCRKGGLGCNADGVHPECRFCAQAPYESVPCPESVMPSGDTCFFPNEPRVDYFWDVDCKMGIKGCLADGIHVHCRFCGSDVYSDIPCP